MDFHVDDRVFHILPRGFGRPHMVLLSATVTNVTPRRIVIKHDGHRWHRNVLPISITKMLPANAELVHEGKWIIREAGQ